MAETKVARGAGAMKLIGINALVLFVILNVLYWTIPVVDGLAALARWSTLGHAFRSLPPAYAATDAEWLRKYWVEVDRGGAVYKSYVAWRRVPTVGETINVEGPYLRRRTINAGTAGAAKAYFFGGSTMWGSGAPDGGTIPSQFAALTGLHAENFGEGAWVAHQGLAMLIKLLQAGHRPDLVVFYDGVNDVLQKCRAGVTPDAHGREPQFDAVLRRSANAYGFRHYFAPIITLAENIAQALPGSLAAGGYDCDTDRGKAEAVAAALVRDWEFAKHLTEWHGGRFIGALQPVAYFSRTRRDHLPLTADHERQYRAVYPLMRDMIARDGRFHDLVAALDVDQTVYLDWSHLSPQGNRHMAEAIRQLAQPLLPLR
jgi:lysophospholipase L1-like esterase